MPTLYIYMSLITFSQMFLNNGSGSYLSPAFDLKDLKCVFR